jgi:hypothetical protein
VKPRLPLENLAITLYPSILGDFDVWLAKFGERFISALYDSEQSGGEAARIPIALETLGQQSLVSANSEQEAEKTRWYRNSSLLSDNCTIISLSLMLRESSNSFLPVTPLYTANGYPPLYPSSALKNT